MALRMRPAAAAQRRWRTAPYRPTTAPRLEAAGARAPQYSTDEQRLADRVREEVLAHPLQRTSDGKVSPQNIAVTDERILEDLHTLEKSRYLREGNQFHYITAVYWIAVASALGVAYSYYLQMAEQRDNLAAQVLMHDLRREEAERAAAAAARRR
eukprot:TRINITY_DN27216_c0_g1_i1.p1 TRINITY_DN27216_c0_g1~~TRINITY_DN27216_c0_g1_i1.p1  ORF type:complete len:155 (+),score=40.81 TRINITY_DN27216_c0_g1_i1:77-541(+)